VLCEWGSSFLADEIRHGLKMPQPQVIVCVIAVAIKICASGSLRCWLIWIHQVSKSR